jgi:hypothetical protein
LGIGCPAVLCGTSGLRYTSGVSITAQNDRVVFAESIRGKSGPSIVLPDIAAKYVQTLWHVNYRSLGINPSGYVVFGDEAVLQAREFMINRFLSSTPWGDWKPPLKTAGVKLTFTLDPWIMNVSIDEGIVQQAGKPPSATIIVAGNFHKELSGKTGDERLMDLLESLKQWSTVLDHFAS